MRVGGGGRRGKNNFQVDSRSFIHCIGGAGSHYEPREMHRDAALEMHVCVNTSLAQTPSQTRTKVNPSAGRSRSVFLAGSRCQFLAHSSRPRRDVCVSSSSYLAATHICPDFLLLFAHPRLFRSPSTSLPTTLREPDYHHNHKAI